MQSSLLKSKFKVYRWLPAVLWMTLIFYLSSRTGQPRFAWMATAGHIVEYSVLTALYLFALVQIPTPKVKQGANPSLTNGGSYDFQKQFFKAPLTAFFLSSFYGLTDELHQYFVPGRFADPLDLLVDSLAAFIVVAVFVFAKKRRVS